jgi:DNA-binding response OmpR family regulator
MSNPARVLVVDDETNIRVTLAAMLGRAGYAVATGENGFEAVALLEQQVFDLLLVDLKMPGMDGMQVIAAARQIQPDIAVIVLTGHGSMESAIDGLHQGIFDYLQKTSDPGFVIERVAAGLAARAQQVRQKALLTIVGDAVQELRSVPTPSAEAASGQGRVITAGALRLDPWRQEATLHGRTLALTPTEFRVLVCLAERAGALQTYGELVRCVQGYEVPELEASELIKPHIHHLRQKLEPDPSAPRYLLNVRGKGYLFSPIGE